MNPSAEATAVVDTAPVEGSEPRRVASAVRGRDRYLDMWRAAALVRVVTYHVFGWVWLTVLFPAMGLMFALAGSLMANSLDRTGSAAVGRRLRRLLPPLWAFGAVAVPLLFATGWRTPPGAALGWGELLWWIFPARTPPVGSQSWAWAFNSVLWYIVTYLWFVLLSPALLAAFRRWPWPTLACAVAVPIAAFFNVVTVGGYFNEQAINISSYLACWILGFAHHDGLLRRIPARRYACTVAVLAVVGAGWVLAAALAHGTFDLNRIAGGNTLWSMAFVMTVLRFRPRLDWVARIRPLNRAVELLNARAVTVYLWHLPCGMVAALLLPPLTFPNWIGGIVIRLAGVWLLTIVAVALFGWIEDIAARRTPALIPRPVGAAAPPSAATAVGRVPGNHWHRVMVTMVAGLAVGLVTTAFTVSPGAPTQSQDRQPQHEVTHYLSDLLFVLDGVTAPAPATRDATVLPGSISIDGELYPRAVVAPAPSRLRVRPPAGCDRMHAVIKVGLAGGAGARVVFSVRADDRTVFDSGEQTRASAAERIDVGVTGATLIDLITTSPTRGASAIWADASFICTP